MLSSCGEYTLLIACQVSCIATQIGGVLLKRTDNGRDGIVLSEGVVPGTM